MRLGPALIRPAEVDHLIGDASKARKELNWTPSVPFQGLVKMMVDADIERLTQAAAQRRLVSLSAERVAVAAPARCARDAEPLCTRSRLQRAASRRSQPDGCLRSTIRPFQISRSSR